MLYFSIENACGKREKQPWLRGGLRTDGFMADHGRIMLRSSPHCKCHCIRIP